MSWWTELGTGIPLEVERREVQREIREEEQEEDIRELLLKLLRKKDG